MLYVIHCEDKADSFERRRSTRNAHLQYLSQLNDRKKLVIAGPLLKQDTDNLLEAGTKGSLIIAEFDSLQQAKEWAVADPYVTAGVFQNITIEPFKPVLPT